MVSEGDELPNPSTVVRYAGFAQMEKDQNDVVSGPSATAFHGRRDEDYLSVTWCEYFVGAADLQLRCPAIGAVREVTRRIIAQHATKPLILPCALHPDRLNDASRAPIAQLVENLIRNARIPPTLGGVTPTNLNEIRCFANTRLCLIRVRTYREPSNDTGIARSLDHASDQVHGHQSQDLVG